MMKKKSNPGTYTTNAGPPGATNQNSQSEEEAYNDPNWFKKEEILVDVAPPTT